MEGESTEVPVVHEERVESSLDNSVHKLVGRPNLYASIIEDACSTKAS